MWNADNDIHDIKLDRRVRSYDDNRYTTLSKLVIS